MAYATVTDVQARLAFTLSTEQSAMCATLLEDAAAVIDAYNKNADAENKKVVSCRMVIRAIGNGAETGMPIGATQGTMSALGYSQTFTYSAGAVGELYLAKLDKKLLGVGDRIGSYSPVEALVGDRYD